MVANDKCLAFEEMVVVTSVGEEGFGGIASGMGLLVSAFTF